MLTKPITNRRFEITVTLDCREECPEKTIVRSRAFDHRDVAGALHPAEHTVWKPTRSPACRIDRDDLDGFDPLVDAVPDTFTGNRIMVEVTEPLSVSLAGEKFNLDGGVQSVPEDLGVFAMARGHAEKARE